MAIRTWAGLGAAVFFAAVVTVSAGQEPKPAQPGKKGKAKAAKVEVTYPPKLPDGKEVVTDTSPDFVKVPAGLRPGVTVAKTPPAIDFLYYPGQTYEGKPWSNWGDSLAANGKYYASVGDHLA